MKQGSRSGSDDSFTGFVIDQLEGFGRVEARRLFGGRGLIVGSLLGALIVGVFRNGLALAGVDVLYQTLVVGVLVIVAVATDQWIRRVRA